MDFELLKPVWIRAPKHYKIEKNSVTVITEPRTDLWQRTYYGFRNDNAPVLQINSKEKFFSFSVKTEFSSKRRFDQCGIILYMDSDNWIKASAEYENESIQRLGSVVTNGGYSDWATTDIDASVKTIWYRLSRRESDYCIESSFDGVNFKQMRICHLQKGDGDVHFGIYACSPEQSSFEAKFTEFELTDCKWKAHE